MRNVTGWMLAALAMAGNVTSVAAQSMPACLVIGAGQWLPPDPGSIWPGNSALRLLDTAVSTPDSMLGRAGWRELQFIDVHEPRPDPLRDYGFAWGWLSPSPDSLLLLRPAMLSQGVIVRGSWNADTLRGRGVTFADLVLFPMPRANMYAVKYPCDDMRARSAAFSALAKLEQSDVPDPALNAAEDRADSNEFARQWAEASAGTDWIPVDEVIPALRATGDTLPPAARDSALDAVLQDLLVANLATAPAVAEHSYLSPYLGIGHNDTLAVHDPAWLERVRQRYSLAAVCGGSGSRRCPERAEQVIFAASAPMLMPDRLILVTTYRYSATRFSWGLATTPVYLTRAGGRWNVLCHGVSIYDDGSR